MWPTKIAQVLCGGPFPFEHAGGDLRITGIGSVILLHSSILILII